MKVKAATQPSKRRHSSLSQTLLLIISSIFSLIKPTEALYGLSVVQNVTIKFGEPVEGERFYTITLDDGMGQKRFNDVVPLFSTTAKVTAAPSGTWCYLEAVLDPSPIARPVELRDAQLPPGRGIRISPRFSHDVEFDARETGGIEWVVAIRCDAM